MLRSVRETGPGNSPKGMMSIPLNGCNNSMTRKYPLEEGSVKMLYAGGGSRTIFRKTSKESSQLQVIRTLQHYDVD